jgi:hypothetical protein
MYLLSGTREAHVITDLLHKQLANDLYASLSFYLTAACHVAFMEEIMACIQEYYVLVDLLCQDIYR